MRVFTSLYKGNVRVIEMPIPFATINCDLILKSSMKIPNEHHHHFHFHYHQEAPSPSTNVGELSQLTRNPTVRIYSKVEENYSLTVRNREVVLAPSNPRDEYQHWYKDMRHSTRVKDEEGFPGFALVNKATGEVIKHSLGPHHPVRMIPYNPDFLDESILWSESNNLGDGFRCIRMVNNITLNFDAFHGDDGQRAVHDGTNIVLYEWHEGNNQRWKIAPYYCKYF